MFEKKVRIIIIILRGFTVFVPGGGEACGERERERVRVWGGADPGPRPLPPTAGGGGE